MVQKPPNLIEDYLDFYSGTEPPTIFNRWCCISGIASILGRQTWIQHGHSKVYPNQFIMLVGESGTRKSTAIKTFLKPLIKAAGYKTIAANRSSKEKFLLDLQEGMDNVHDPEEDMDVSKESKSGNWTGKSNPTMRELFGVGASSEPSECLVMSDDLNLFLGHSNIEFIEMLTDLWDYEGLYSSRTKSGKSVLITDPTINILAGNTQVGISMAFPPEVIGQGLFSRLIQVFSDPSGRKISFPAPPDPAVKQQIIGQFERIKNTFKGAVPIEPFAMVALDEIYQNWTDISDVRFKSYSTRRFTHLLKLCIVCAAARDIRKIDTRIVEYANTILHYTEFFMPKALGEFGKARHSNVVAKILEILEKEDRPLNPIKDLWKQVSRDLESTTELGKILGALKEAGKIQEVASGGITRVKEKLNFDFPHCQMTLLREYLEQKEKDGLPF